jgi:hypothetical protein
MQTYKKHFYLTGLVALLFLLAACGIPGLASTPPTPAQTLQNSAQAMSQLKSVHFDLSQASLAIPSSSSATNGITFNVTGQGDTVSPDQVSVNLALGQNPLLNLVSTGGKVYVQVMGGVWYSTDASKIKDSLQKIFSQSPATRLGQIMVILQNAKLTDHGQESLGGTSLDHITATLDQQTLQTLNAQLNGLLPADAQNGQNQITQAAIDLWIDQSTGYVHQVKLDVVARVDTSALKQYAQSGLDGSAVVSVELKAQLNFSKFNQPVTIQAPANSVPASY